MILSQSFKILNGERKKKKPSMNSKQREEQIKQKMEELLTATLARD